jgi:hypothetical protein
MRDYMSEARHLFSASVAAAAILAVVGSGCAGSSGDPAALASLEVSDAVMGQMGLVRIEFSNPVSQDTTITLSSTPPGLIMLPSSAKLLDGSLSVDVQYMAVAPGTGQITATSGTLTQAAAIQVVDALVIGAPTTAALEVGAIAPANVVANIRVATPLAVTLTSSEPSIATVTPMVTISQFAQSAEAEVAAVAVGSSTLTASGGGYTTAAPITVVDQAELESITVGTLAPSTTKLASITLSAVPRAGGAISLTSTAPSVAMVPASLPTNGSTVVEVPVTAGTASGTATITATFNNYSVNGIADVTDASESEIPQFCEVAITGSTVIEVGGNVIGEALLCNAAFTTAQSGQITFSAAGVASTPNPTLQLPAGVTVATFPITAVADGTTSVIVVVNGVQEMATLTVQTPTFTMVGTTTLTVIGEVGSETIESNTLLGSDRTFDVSSSAPSVVSVSAASVTDGAGALDTLFEIQAVAVGTAVITASDGVTVLTQTVTVE